MLRIKIVTETGEVPTYETAGAAGMDLRAHLTAPVTLAPLGRTLIPTGLFIELPAGYEAQIRARSGLALKHGIGMPNGIGTIDSDYRGEILVALINFSEEPFTIQDGDRIAQMVVCAHEQVEWEPVDALEDSERGGGGFGHTGVA